MVVGCMKITLQQHNKERTMIVSDKAGKVKAKSKGFTAEEAQAIRDKVGGIKAVYGKIKEAAERGESHIILKGAGNMDSVLNELIDADYWVNFDVRDGFWIVSW